MKLLSNSESSTLQNLLVFHVVFLFYCGVFGFRRGHLFLLVDLTQLNQWSKVVLTYRRLLHLTVLIYFTPIIHWFSHHHSNVLLLDAFFFLFWWYLLLFYFFAEWYGGLRNFFFNDILFLFGVSQRIHYFFFDFVVSFSSMQNFFVVLATLWKI